MNPYLAAAGIRFNDFVFSEPKRLVEWTPPKCAGICAILARDSNWAPKPFQPLCFLEFGNNADLRRLARIPNTGALFVAALPMPFSTTAQRTEIRNELVGAYNPPWQAAAGAALPDELAHKLHELRFLLAGIDRLFEAPSEAPPRRAIGFVPQPAPAPEKNQLTPA